MRTQSPENPTQTIVPRENKLATLAQAHGVGYDEIVIANQTLDPWLPGVGGEVRLPTRFVLPDAPREGIVVNLAERRLYYFPPDRDVVLTYAVGIGRDDFPTPLVKTHVAAHIEKPAWTPTASIRREHLERGDVLPAIVPPGPDNPMGSFALMLNTARYFIHGTNQPFGVGQQVSHGCIRLYDDDIIALAGLVPNGTVVRTVDQPINAGMLGGALYAEFHSFETSGRSLTDVVGTLLRAAEAGGVALDWSRVDALIRDADGVPRQVSADTLAADGESADEVPADESISATSARTVAETGR